MTIPQEDSEVIAQDDLSRRLLKTGCFNFKRKPRGAVLTPEISRAEEYF